MEDIIELIRENYPIILEVIGLILGLCYLYYEYKASKWVWLFAILMPMISLYVYYHRGIYADFGINIYYLITAIYGFVVWSIGGKSGSGVRITHASKTVKWVCGAIALVLWVVIYYILVNFTDSNVPVPDAFTTSLSMVGSWMLARKYVEQWLVWVVVDVVSVGLFIYKGIYPYALLYSIYSVIALMGYRKWKKLMLTQA